MDENHQDKTGNKQIATKDVRWVLNRKSKLWVPKPKKSFAERMGFVGKTPWDFIQLLLIPLVLAGVGYWFTATQTQISLQNSQKQHDTDLQIAADQQRQIILKSCLDDIKDLLLNKSLRASKPKDEVRAVARVEVLAALRQLDGVRKGLLMQFLSEAGLISSSNDVIVDPRRAITGSRIDVVINRSRIDVIINLRGAELSSAKLSFVDLRWAKLSGANLTGADLRYADLRGANLYGANLHGANLSWAKLHGADLGSADLSAANLYGAGLPDADLHAANLNAAILRSTWLSDADLRYADLRYADLRVADLTGADLTDADLRGANLREANLVCSSLGPGQNFCTNLTGAKVTQAQLNEAWSLQGATMPDGSKHP